MNSLDLWNRTLELLERDIPASDIDRWLRPLAVTAVEDQSMLLAAPDAFSRSWIMDKYFDVVERTLEEAAGRKVSVHISEQPVPLATYPVDHERPAPITPPQPDRRSPEADVVGQPINPRYTFETFVIGSSNEFAHAASRAVAANPGLTYNPLFIFGGVGLGKTHLLCAIGHHLREHTDKRVCYITAEQFVHDLIISLRHERMDEFRDRYRDRCDVLLIDDIQFLTGKDKSQEQFFHTFNALYESRRQIVMTCDTYPDDIPGVDERLKSRLQWGLVTDIKPPDIETKAAILVRKAEEDSIHLPMDVAQYLAQSLGANIREMEGALTRLGAFASLRGCAITTDLAQEVLADTLRQGKSLTVEDVQKTTAAYYDVNISDLNSPRKLKVIARPRQIAMYLCRELVQMPTGGPVSFPEIGQRFGGKDHSTVMHACKKIRKELESNTELRRDIQILSEKLAH